MQSNYVGDGAPFVAKFSDRQTAPGYKQQVGGGGATHTASDFAQSPWHGEQGVHPNDGHKVSKHRLPMPPGGAPTKPGSHTSPGPQIGDVGSGGQFANENVLSQYSKAASREALTNAVMMTPLHAREIKRRLNMPATP